MTRTAILVALAALVTAPADRRLRINYSRKPPTPGHVALAALLFLVAAAPSARAVDLSGDYLVNLFDCRLTLTQGGTNLLLAGTCAGNLPISGSGMVDPTTGMFSFSASVGGNVCSYDAVGTGDGEVFSATLTFTGGTGATYCPPGPVAGTKCGNDVVDTQEDCEDGNSVGGDCCSARCRLDPADTACATAGNVCVGLCDGAGSCEPVPNAAPCDDDNTCTTADVCTGGVCAGTPVAASTPCPSDAIDCTNDACDGAGACTHEQVPAGTACTDDFNACTSDVCDVAGACVHPPNNDPCDDWNSCTAGDLCGSGVCHGGALLPPGAACDSDGNVCTDDLCNEAGTCAHRPNANASACDDGNACSSGDVCADGVCIPTGVAPVCEGTIDLTGTWALDPPIFGLVSSVQFLQSGAVLYAVPSPHSPTGAINPATGLFSVDVPVHILEGVVLYVQIDGTASASGETFEGIATDNYGWSSVIGSVRGMKLCGSGPCCGNGAIDPGEACDDALCCDASCSTALPAGTICSQDADLCSTGSRCNGAGKCEPPADPAASCQGPTATRPAMIDVKRGRTPKSTVLGFKWSGTTTDIGFGDPTTSTDYALCIYDETAGVGLTTRKVRADAARDASLWRTSQRGFRYERRLAGAGELARVSLSSAASGLAKIKVTGKGATLFFGLPYAPKVWVQVRASNGGCWGATFRQPKASTPNRFRSTSD